MGSKNISETGGETRRKEEKRGERRTRREEMKELEERREKRRKKRGHTVINSWARTCSIVKRFAGALANSFVIISLAEAETLSNSFPK
jgi:hypothetical protein